MRAPADRVGGTVRGRWARGRPHRTRGWWHGVEGVPGAARGSGSTVARAGWCLSFGPWCLKPPVSPLAVVLSDASVALHRDHRAETSSLCSLFLPFFGPC